MIYLLLRPSIDFFEIFFWKKSIFWANWSIFKEKPPYLQTPQAPAWQNKEDERLLFMDPARPGYMTVPPPVSGIIEGVHELEASIRLNIEHQRAHSKIQQETRPGSRKLDFYLPAKHPDKSHGEAKAIPGKLTPARAKAGLSVGTPTPIHIEAVIGMGFRAPRGSSAVCRDGRTPPTVFPASRY